MKKVAILCKWMYTEVERPVMLDSYLVVSIDWIQRIISKDFFDNCRPLVFDDEKSKIIKKNQKNKTTRMPTKAKKTKNTLWYDIYAILVSCSRDLCDARTDWNRAKTTKCNI